MTSPRQPYIPTGSCERCKFVEKSYRRRAIVDNLVVVHTDRAVCAGKKSTEKRETLQEIEVIISALRNREGGQVIVHIDGQKSQDRYLEHFDEFITRSFSELIEDGQTYVQAYNRQWLSEVDCFKDATDFLLLKVKGGAGIATVDFNTKFNNDIENLKPQSLSVAEILFSQTSPNDEGPKDRKGPVLRGLHDVQNLQENRSIEIKAFKPKPETLLSEFQNNTLLLVDYIWNNLKLKDNLTSMSKVPGGGNYFVGISEVATTTHGYKTKQPQIIGFAVRSPEELKKCIMDKIQACVTVLVRGTFTKVPNDLLKVHCHTVSQSRYVLEVAVRYFDGIVFYDKEGPLAYIIQDKKIRRIGKEEWLQKFEDRFRRCVHGQYM